MIGCEWTSEWRKVVPRDEDGSMPIQGSRQVECRKGSMTLYSAPRVPWDRHVRKGMNGAGKKKTLDTVDYRNGCRLSCR